MQTWVKHNRTLMTQNLVRFFNSSLELGFYTKPRFKLLVIQALVWKGKINRIAIQMYF